MEIQHLREMINSNNKDREMRYIIIAIVNDVRVTVHESMAIAREDEEQSCQDQMGEQ